jgi:digalactosyldiacylglycerol synthase
MMRRRSAILSILFLHCLPLLHSVNAIFKARRVSRLLCNEVNQRNEHHQRIRRAPRNLKSILCRLQGGAIPDDNIIGDNDSDHSTTSLTRNETLSSHTTFTSDNHLANPNFNTTTMNNCTLSNATVLNKRQEINYISSLQETTLKAKQLFLDKISHISTALLKSEDAVVDNITKNSNLLIDDNSQDDNDDEVTLQSDLMRPGRKMTIVTTASIPWFTGTAVNPLLRAAYLDRLTKKINKDHAQLKDNNVLNTVESSVCLVIPWLEREQDRLELYGEKHNFSTPQEQESYIRKWLKEEANMPEEADPETGIKIIFYTARYHSLLKSIFAMGDIMSVISDSDADVCILEEPEHLNWFRAPGDGWTKKFRFVIGIIHTNYVDYASSHYSGLWTAPAMKVISSAMVRAYCHVVIKLSDTLQTFAEEKERISNVHGVRLDFLNEGTERAERALSANGNGIHDGMDADSPLDIDLCKEAFSSSQTSSSIAEVYYIGKLLWAKGLDKMLDLQSYYKTCTGNYFTIDVYGNGPEEKEIKKAFHGRSSSNSLRQSKKNELQESHKNDDSVELSGSDMPGSFSTHIAKISRHIQATTQTIKSTTESIDLQFPKSLHELRKEPIPSSFPGRVDHATLGDYKVFVNPSESEVLCTTTAEALAMGKFVIIPMHPSNTFFVQFDNCLPYRNKLEFAANLHWALNREPEPLKPEQKRLLTWEAATERLVSASAITRREAKARHRLGTSKLDERIAWFHNAVGKGARGDTLRRVLGGGPISDQVAYELMKQQPLGDGDDNGEFVGPSLAEAIRTTLSNAVPGAMASLYRTDSSSG